MKNKITYAFLFLSILACNKSNNEDQKLYRGCCVSSPVVDDIGGANVFIANIFTPNGDGINDIFFPSTNTIAIDKISEMRLSDFDGNILFEKSEIDPMAAAEGWNGQTNGSVFKGTFNYRITIRAFDGEEKMFQGVACSYVCEPQEFPAENFPNCFFPNQNDGNGGLNSNIPALEDDCF